MTESTTIQHAGAAAPAIHVEGLAVGYRLAAGQVPVDVVHGVDVTVHPGETVALVGQSGSGKSTIALAVAGLLPEAGNVTAGRIRVHGQDVTGLNGKQWRALRGNVLGYVPQDPLSSLDPLVKAGRQVARSLRLHTGASRAEASARAEDLLAKVGIADPARAASSYPHELSGGQLQRVLIASAIAAGPSVLIADEPTSALDVTVQKTILDLLGELKEELGLALLFITHDLALAQDRSDAVVVLNDGVVKESGRTAQVLNTPAHAYTRALLADAPALSPDAFARSTRTGAGPETAEPAITVEGLTKSYASLRTGSEAHRALDHVDLTVRARSIHALVGESGSGKTTLARIVAGLESFDGGTVRIGDRELPKEPPTVNRHARRLQLVYQNALAAIDPRYTVRQVIEEPLRIHGARDARERGARVQQVLDRVALSAAVLGRRPREISGGQRQRVAVARALVLAPDILVLDEPTSALDVTVQARTIELLMELREQQDLTYLFISHDLSLVRQIADHVSVLERGVLVESRSARDLFTAPEHPYTARLIAAIPGQHTRAARLAS